MSKAKKILSRKPTTASIELRKLLGRAPRKGNLNDYEFDAMLTTPMGTYTFPLADYGKEAGKIEVVFMDVEDFLVESVKDVDVVIGCTAYSSSDSELISAIKQDKMYSLIVSRERDKKGHLKAWPPRKIIEGFPTDFLTWVEDELHPDLSITDQSRVSAIEAINAPLVEGGKHPRLHSKFLVTAKKCDGVWQPVQAITGSFNFSSNAGYCLENVVSIKCSKIINAYIKQWHQTLCIALHMKERGLVTLHHEYEYHITSNDEMDFEAMSSDPSSSYNYALSERIKENEED